MTSTCWSILLYFIFMLKSHLPQWNPLSIEVTISTQRQKSMAATSSWRRPWPTRTASMWRKSWICCASHSSSATRFVGWLFFFWQEKKTPHQVGLFEGKWNVFFWKGWRRLKFWSFVLIRFCKRLLVEESKEQNFERFCGWLILFFLSEASAFLNHRRKGVLWIKKFTTNGPLSKLLEFLDLDTQVFRSVGPVGDFLENCETTIGPPKVGILTPSPGYGTQCSNSGISSHFEEPVVRVRLSGG